MLIEAIVNHGKTSFEVFTGIHTEDKQLALKFHKFSKTIPRSNSLYHIESKNAFDSTFHNWMWFHLVLDDVH